MVTNLQEKKYLTPYVAWLNVIGGSEGEISRFMKQVDQLPEEVQVVLKNFSTAEFIEDEVAPQFNLTNQQVNDLTIAIKDLLLGESHGKDFISNVQLSLNISEEMAQQIVVTLTKELLGSIIGNLGELQTDKYPEKTNKLPTLTEPQAPQIPERSDLKIEPDINRNNIVDLRNK